MHISKIIIEGYKTFRKFELDLNEHLNIIVGDNETGKSTLLEAINLVMSCQIDSRNIHYELNPHIFNNIMVRDYFEGKCPTPPQILIEAYLTDDDDNQLAKFKGTNNSKGQNSPGLYLKIELNEDFAEEFREYTKSRENPNIMPIEYYSVVWRSFADNSVAIRCLPFRATIIDTSLVRGYWSFLHKPAKSPVELPKAFTVMV